MHSVHIAEWILALVTTRDRAASTVGDLTEGAATRGDSRRGLVLVWCLTNGGLTSLARRCGTPRARHGAGVPRPRRLHWDRLALYRPQWSRVFLGSHGERTSTSFGLDRMEALVHRAGAV